MRNLFVIATMLLASAAQAEPFLLGEITFGGGHSGTWVESPDTPLDFQFLAVNNDSSVSVSMGGLYSMHDVPAVVHATPEQLADLNVLLHDPNAGLHFLSIANPRYFGLFEMWSPVPFYFFTTYVPKTDGSFSGYTITDVTQTIGNISFVTNDYHCDLFYCGPRWQGTGSQTISIYGEPISIPEPDTWTMTFTGLTLLFVYLIYTHLEFNRRK